MTIHNNFPPLIEKYAALGLSMIDMALGTKRPLTFDWPNKGVKDAETAKRVFGAGKRNVGIVLGERSGGLVDIDVDCYEALQLVDLLPATNAVFGRASTPRAHLIYRVSGPAPTVKFADPLSKEDSMIIEVRGDGGLQTVFPPSMHPSGERIEWSEFGEISVVSYDELVNATSKIAAQVVIDRHGDEGRNHPTVKKWLGEDSKPKDEPSNRPQAEAYHEARRASAGISGERERAWAAAALEGVAADLAGVGKGGRNHALNASAYRLGRLVARGWIDQASVILALTDACHANGLTKDKGSSSVRATLQSGLRSGIANPHEDLPDDERETPEDLEAIEIGKKIVEARKARQKDESGAQGGEQPEQGADDAQAGKAQGKGHYHRRPRGGGVSLEDFHAYMPMHNYIFAPTREMWPGNSVDSRIPPVLLTKKNGEPLEDEEGNQKQLRATTWLDRNRAVEQMTWAPGEPMLIRDKLMANGGWIDRQGVTCFNLYLPPTLRHGSAADAGMWLDHVHRVFGDDAEHIIKWLAHRVQSPQEKINHALVLGGNQGVGKDTLLEPVKQAVGPWNFQEVSPTQTIGRFNGFLKSVILRVSEARDLGDTDRYKFYDHMKAYTAAPPDVLRVDEKHLREHSILNCCGVIITTNYKTDGIYLPADDRRHFVAWTDLDKEDFTPEYWDELWGWYSSGGIQNVAAYLAGLDLSTFNAKAPPPKTQAFWDIVDAGRAPEDSELADAIDALGAPDALTIAGIATCAEESLSDWLNDRKSRRTIPHRLETCGYTPVRNDAATDGLWVIGGKRQVIYAKKDMPQRERFAAARELVSRRGWRG